MPFVARACASSAVISSGSQPSSTSSAERLEHEVRIHRGGAVADERRDAVHAARLARLDDDAGLQARALADEVVVHGRRSRAATGSARARGRRAVGEDEDVRAGGERCVRLGAEPVERALEARRRLRRRATSCRSCTLMKTSERTCRSCSSSVSSRIGFVDHELARVLGVSSSRLCSDPTLACDAHHDRLADRVDRRVRHLREQLLEVRVEQRLAAREHGERRVVPHRADRLLGVPRERREDHLHVLLRVAEEELPRAQRLGRRPAASSGSGRSREAHRLLVDPLARTACASRSRA